MSEDKRITGRRKVTRRMGDMLQGKLTEAERQQFDRLMYNEYLAEDRRTNTRRSGGDRREGAEKK